MKELDLRTRIPASGIRVNGLAGISIEEKVVVGIRVDGLVGTSIEEKAVVGGSMCGVLVSKVFLTMWRLDGAHVPLWMMHNGGTSMNRACMWPSLEAD